MMCYYLNVHFQGQRVKLFTCILHVYIHKYIFKFLNIKRMLHRNRYNKRNAPS